MSSKEIIKILDLNINKITSDSKKVGTGDVFVAIEGETFDGHDFIHEAVIQGVVAVVYQNGSYKTTSAVYFVKTPNTRKALAELAATYYGNVHKKLKLVGITGTNGKTTTSEITYQLLNKLGRKTGLISTISAKSPAHDIDTGYHVTTPNALELHKLINTVYKEGCEFLIIETTSHGIDQYRTHGLKFEVCAVTNVTPEHLDYHKTFENYLKTKAKIFTQSKKIILNKWDPSIKYLVKEIPSHRAYKVVDYKKLTFPSSYTKAFPGDYNLENASIAHAIVGELVGSIDMHLFECLTPIKGRMEVISNTKGFNIIIDFAHDPASLEKLLKEVRKITKNNILLVFGCAGLRDTTKREKMGRLAGVYANKVVITSEDPRTESVDDINKEIEKGIKETGYVIGKDYFIIKDRQEAISLAINKLAKSGDTVLITGKGHEKSMCFGTTEVPWTDQEAVQNALQDSSEC